MVSLNKSSKIRHLYRKHHNRKRRNSTRKSCIKFRFWQKTRFTHAIAPNKRANSHDLETDLNLLTITFHLLNEQSYTSFINSRWKWVTLSVRSLTVFKEKILVTDKKCFSSAKVGLYWEKLHTLSSVPVFKTLGIHTSKRYVQKNMCSLTDLSEHVM